MNDDIVTLAALGVAAYFGYRVFNGIGGIGSGVGGTIGGVVGGASSIVNETFGGIADIADSLNPFTEGPILGWI